MAANVGELRPSQLLFTSGVGAVVDLPEISAMVLGIDDWPVEAGRRLTEPRLLAALRRPEWLGPQVAELRTPPETPEGFRAGQDPAPIGVPVAPFPTWLRCPRCRLLAPLSGGLFTLRPEPYRPDRVRYTHDCDGRGRIVAIAARFLLACRRGHHDDFPWAQYVHRDQPCTGRWELELREMGMGAEAAKIEVYCRTCGKGRRMSEAFGPEADANLPACRGYHPHLGTTQDACPEPARTILLGASNSWFALTLSVVAIPTETDPLRQLVSDTWAALEPVPDQGALSYAMTLNTAELAPLHGHDPGAVWAAIEAHRAGEGDDHETGDLRVPEWAVLSAPAGVAPTEDFRTRIVGVPLGREQQIAEVVLCERLRKVVALTGFTRVESPEDATTGADDGHTAPISRGDPLWAPCVEVRGEGIFLRLPERQVCAWEERYRRSESARRLLEGHRLWRARRDLDPATGFPGWRYVLLHSLSHALIRQLALECGYSASSISERIYATRPEGDGPAMAGILLYTAAPDSEGTLGGLVALGEPERLGTLLEQAIDHAGLCSSDPLCAEHDPREDRSVHLAACHACQLAAETSCERGNRYLDRAALVQTFAVADLGYFRGA